jgi:rubrerythrin
MSDQTDIPGQTTINGNRGLKRKRESHDEENKLVATLDQNIKAVETEISQNAAEYEKCRKILLLGVASIAATEQTAKMDNLMKQLNEMKAKRAEAIRNKESYEMKLVNDKEAAAVIDQVRESRAKRRRLYPRDKEQQSEQDEISKALAQHEADKIANKPKENAANCPGQCKNLTVDKDGCVVVCSDCGHIYEKIHCNAENPLCTAPKYVFLSPFINCIESNPNINADMVRKVLQVPDVLAGTNLLSTLQR